jgi:hypothetical protein
MPKLNIQEFKNMSKLETSGKYTYFLSNSLTIFLVGKITNLGKIICEKYRPVYTNMYCILCIFPPKSKRQNLSPMQIATYHPSTKGHNNKCDRIGTVCFAKSKLAGTEIIAFNFWLSICALVS